jgi:hypothetical protein
MNRKIVAIRWLRSSDRGIKRDVSYEIVPVEDGPGKLRSTMTYLMCDRHDIDQCLVRHEGQLIVCDRMNNARNYYKATVDYHPLMHLLD